MYLDADNKLKSDKSILKNSLLYGFLGLGSLCVITDKCQDLATALSEPIIIVLGLWLVFEYFKERHKDRSYSDFLIYTISLAILAWLVEYTAVQTDPTFGNYIYNDSHIFSIQGVPLSVSFVWIVSLYSARAITLDFYNGKSKVLFSLFTASFVTALDILIENTSVVLRYKFWLEESVPLSNYLSWFVLSFLFSFLAESFNVFENKTPKIAGSFYWALFTCSLAISLFAS